MKKIVILLSFLVLSLQADKCEELSNQAKKDYPKMMALIKTDIASFKAYEMTNDFLNLSTQAIAECEVSKSREAFRNQRELSINMQRVAEVRDKFKVLTFQELKAEAVAQAKKEVECVNVYNNNTSIRRRPSNGATILPIKN